MARFNNILRTKFSKENRRKINECLLKWERSGSLIGKAVPKNIKNEIFLSTKHFKLLLDVILENNDQEIPDLENAFVLKCRTMKRKGGRVKVVPLPRVIGRAVNRNYFEDWLFEKYCRIYFDCIEDVTEFIDRAIEGVPLTTNEKKIFLNSWIAWATWDEDGSDLPFSFLRSRDPNEIISCLGLDLKRKGQSIILLTYSREKSRLPIYRATIADAELFTPFDPVIEGNKCFGRTRPWPIEVFFNMGEYDEMNPPWIPVSRPESIHGACTFKHLISIDQRKK